MSQCVFCDKAQFEERLAGESERFWIIATLGQISNGGYLLLVPKRHVLCVGAMETSELKELEAMREKIHEAVLQEYGIPPKIVFEHGIVGQTIKHAHLHLIPEAASITERIRKDFPHNEIAVICSWDELKNLYAEKQKPYLLWRDSDGGARVCWNPEAPLQYLRAIVAEVVGRPERANWRAMDPELDKRLWAGTVARLKPYFS